MLSKSPIASSVNQQRNQLKREDYFRKIFIEFDDAFITKMNNSDEIETALRQFFTDRPQEFETKVREILKIFDESIESEIASSNLKNNLSNAGYFEEITHLSNIIAMMNENFEKTIANTKFKNPLLNSWHETHQQNISQKLKKQLAALTELQVNDALLQSDIKEYTNGNFINKCRQIVNFLFNFFLTSQFFLGNNRLAKITSYCNLHRELGEFIFNHGLDFFEDEVNKSTCISAFYGSWCF